MSNEELLLWIKRMKEAPISTSVHAYDTVIDEIEKCVQKQTPKKPYAIEDEVYGVMKICPVCSWRVINGVSDYCLHCGQGIDWSES